MKERETARKTDKMTQAEQQICRYFDQRKDFEIDHNEIDAEKLEAVLLTDCTNGSALETAAGFLILSHHPKD